MWSPWLVTIQSSPSYQEGVLPLNDRGVVYVERFELPTSRSQTASSGRTELHVDGVAEGSRIERLRV